MSVALSPSNTIGFHRPLNVLRKNGLTISNYNSLPVAFKIKTTAPKNYCVRPNSGRVEPGKTIIISILLQAMRNEPPLSEACRDKFLVQSMLITPGVAAMTLQDMWHPINGEKVEEHQQKLRVLYLPPVGQEDEGEKGQGNMTLTHTGESETHIPPLAAVTVSESVLSFASSENPVVPPPNLDLVAKYSQAQAEIERLRALLAVMSTPPPTEAHRRTGLLEDEAQGQVDTTFPPFQLQKPRTPLSGDRPRSLLDHDLNGITAEFSCRIEDPQKYRTFLAQRGQEAQSALNRLQALLDFPRLNPSYRSSFVHALIQLSRYSGLYPECLVLQGVELEGFDAKTFGKFGDIWKGKILGQGVAVKVLRFYETTDLAKHLKDFCREAVIWRQLCHPNILPFFGVYHLNSNRSRVCFVSPWMENGNVTEFLTRFPDTDGVRLALDIAEGLEYLHSMKLVHGDLKGLNILITQSRRACLADFGISVSSECQFLPSLSTFPTAGTLRWEAPELLDTSQDRVDFSTDIYAYACVGYEIFAANIPFYHIQNDVAVIVQVLNGHRSLRPTSDLSIRRGLDDEMWELIESCWQSKPSERPTAQEVVIRLQSRPSLVVDTRGPRDWDHSSVSSMRLALADTL